MSNFSFTTKTRMRPAVFLALVLGAIIVLSYTFHRTETKNTVLRCLLGQEEMIQVATDVENRSRILPMRDGTPGRTRLEWEEKDEELKSILQNLDLLMPKVTFSDVSTTTSAKDSKAVLLNRKDSYCVGDSLTARLDLYDHLGNRKEYGGDFLQARIFSSKLKAGASGLIEDYKNGTYLVNFTLLWEGNVSVSISLIHPSEGASALWAARKRGYDKVAFTGTYLKGTSNLFSECGLNVSTKSELCEYLDRRDKESFYCIKPKNVSCKALVRLKSYHKPITFLTALEERLFDRSNIGVEIPHTFGDIRVLACGGKKTTTASEKCRIGMTSPFPSGFLWQNQWHPLFCNVSTFSTLDLVNTCLKRKLIYLLGDSTLRQWIEYLPKRVNTLKYIDLHEIGRPQKILAVDTDRNIQIYWKKHGHPFIWSVGYSMKDHSYIAREIDKVAGDKDTAVVITLGQHFRPFPIELFIRRALNVREAIRRLLLRSPDTKVIIKAENTQDNPISQERFGDFHGYAHYLALKDIFQDLKVGFIDAWDMAIAYGMKMLHPPDYVLENQINMFLTYIC